jgi:hypothetical protein
MPPQYQLKYDTTEEHFQQCLTVRKAVFVEEQGYDEAIEVDELSGFRELRRQSELPHSSEQLSHPTHSGGLADTAQKR